MRAGGCVGGGGGGGGGGTYRSIFTMCPLRTRSPYSLVASKNVWKGNRQADQGQLREWSDAGSQATWFSVSHP